MQPSVPPPSEEMLIEMNTHLLFEVDRLERQRNRYARLWKRTFGVLLALIAVLGWGAGAWMYYR